MTRLRLLLLSVALYAAALALPALVSFRSSSGEQPTMGWQCLVFGVMFCFLIVPGVVWVANPWLWVLWYRAARNIPSRSTAWLCLVWAVISLVLLCIGYQVAPLWGAGLWIASIATGIWAARLTEE